MSLGLAAAIAAVATLLRLQRRRRARLTVAASPSVAPQPSPMPRSLAGVDMIGSRHLGTGSGDHRPATPAVPAPVGVGPDATEMSLFDLPGPGIALHGQGAVPAARAILAAVLSTNATETAVLRPVVVTTTGLLARLLPEDAPAVGLDPDGTAYDGERLVVLADTAAAITHAEEEMIGRRRLLDTFDADTITDLNARSDHAETQPPYVLLIESTTRHAARLEAVAAHHAALDLHSVILGPHDGIPTIEITAEGTVTGDGGHQVARLSTLGADDLAAVLAMLTDALARPEAGADVDDPRAETLPAAVTVEAAEPVPAQSEDAAALVRLRVLGPVTVITDAGPIATGMRSGSYTVLAVLAAHPAGRTLDQLAAALHPDVDPAAAVKRVRTDITSARRVLRAATGHDEPMFIVYDPATGRYQLDPQTVTVDLWQMLTAIDQATSSDDEATTLAALRRATELYAGDFAEGHDHAWATDYATSYRHQILTAYARIAEILEPDHPDQAIAALERAADLDPVNEELYQRIMRIHGRQQRLMPYDAPCAGWRNASPTSATPNHHRPPAASPNANSDPSPRPMEDGDERESAPANAVGRAGDAGPRRGRLGHREHPARPSEPDLPDHRGMAAPGPPDHRRAGHPHTRLPPRARRHPDRRRLDHRRHRRLDQLPPHGRSRRPIRRNRHCPLPPTALRGRTDHRRVGLPGRTGRPPPGSREDTVGTGHNGDRIRRPSVGAAAAGAR